MKAAIFLFRVLLFVLLFSAMVTVSSCGKKPTTTNIEKDTLIENSVKTVHFTNQLNKSLAINDTFRFGFPNIITGATKIQDCDSLCNQKIKEALANASTSKQSGNNGYNFYYDKYRNQFVLNVKLGETIEQYKDSLVNERSQKKEKYFIKKEIPVDKPLTKTQLFLQVTGLLFWILLVAVVGWKIFRMFNPIK